MRRNLIVPAATAVFGLATIALASWTSPFSGLTHEDSSTCGLEPTQRACFICCSTFNGSIFSPEGAACAGTCPIDESAPGVGN